MPDRTYKIGDVVLDDLTGMVTVVTQVLVDSKFTLGYKVSTPWLEGRRFSWEISRVEDKGAMRSSDEYTYSEVNFQICQTCYNFYTSDNDTCIHCGGSIYG